jgi:sec-independent protein translocase protein TatB
MFDIGFSEVVVIFVLALIVLGPEKLPKVAAQVGRWIGRARGMARQFREQLEEEVNLEEIRRSTQQAMNRTSPPPAATPSPPAEPAHGQTSPDEAHAAAPAASSSDPYAAVTGAHGEALSEHSSAATSTVSSQAYAPPDAPPIEEPEQPVYPDTYSHAHPTDSLGRQVPPPTTEVPPPESGQHDWVEGVTGAKK